MGSFATGFVSGFQVGDQIVARRKQQKLNERTAERQDQRLRLDQVAAGERTEAFRTNAKRFRDTNRAAELGQRSLRGDLTEDEKLEFESIRHLDPATTAAGAQSRKELRIEEAGREIQGAFQQEDGDRAAAAQARDAGLQGVADQSNQATQSQGDPGAQQPSQFSVDETGEPVLNTPQAELDTAREIGPQGSGIREEGLAHLDDMLTEDFVSGNLDVPSGEGDPLTPFVPSGSFGATKREVPEGLATAEEWEAAKEQGAIFAEQFRADQQKLITGETGDRQDVLEQARLQQELNRDAVAQYSSTVDIDDPQGAAMRKRIRLDPVGELDTYSRTRPRIMRENPNVAREMDRIFWEQRGAIAVAHATANAEAMAQGLEQGTGIDKNNPEIAQANRAAMSAHDNTDRVREGHLQDLDRSIEGENIPVGNSDFTQNTAAATLETPAPGRAYTDEAFKVNNTVATRAVNDLRGGQRTMTKKQHSAFAFMLGNGLMTSEQYLDVMSGKAFKGTPTKFSFMNLGNGQVARHSEDGQLMVINTRAQGAADKSVLGVQQSELVKEFSRAHIPDPKEAERYVLEDAARREWGFHLFLQQHGGAMFGLDGESIDLSKLGNIERDDLQLMWMVYTQFEDAKSDYANSILTQWKFLSGRKSTAALFKNIKPGSPEMMRIVKEFDLLEGQNFQLTSGIDLQGIRDQYLRSGNAQDQADAQLDEAAFRSAVEDRLRLEQGR